MTGNQFIKLKVSAQGRNPLANTSGNSFV